MQNAAPSQSRSAFAVRSRIDLVPSALRSGSGPPGVSAHVPGCPLVNYRLLLGILKLRAQAHPLRLQTVQLPHTMLPMPSPL